MKVKYLLLMLVLGVALVTPMVGAEFRTITVDGLTGDWAGVPPFVTDPQDDPGLNHQAEDIKAVYVANDDTNLYFWMEIFEYVDGSIVVGTPIGYNFIIDIIPGSGDEFLGGADYQIRYISNVVICEQDGEGIVELWYWDGDEWNTIDCEGLQGVMNGYDIEVSVPWACIGGQRCFQSFFAAEIMPVGTDYAPDKVGEEIVTIEYCPCVEAVGGELLPFNMAKMIIPYAIFGVTVIALLASLNSRKTRKIYPS